MSDWYSEDISRLQGQPKRAIADYVEQNGILVPRRFNTLAEARASGLPILVRSEHPLEYAKISGLLDSFRLDWADEHVGPLRDLEEAKEYVYLEENFDHLHRRIHTHTPFLLRNYCSLLGIDYLEQKRQLTFSAWERLKEMNRTVAADSSIPNRYHILENFSDDKKWDSEDRQRAYNYFVVEDGKIVLRDLRTRRLQAREDFGDVINFYERIRHLPNFDPNNCPIIETQETNDKHYFLQYHRGRQFKKCEFELSRPLEDGEKKALFVRGHTPEEGLTGVITVTHPPFTVKWDKWPIPEKEFGSFDFHYNWAFSNIMDTRRKVRMIHPSYKGDLGWELFKYSAQHARVSELFAAEVSIISEQDIFRDPPEKGIETGEEISRKEFSKMIDHTFTTGEILGIPMRIISDGRNAYYKRLD